MSTKVDSKEESEIKLKEMKKKEERAENTCLFLFTLDIITA